MSQETDGQDTGAEALAGGVDPAAIALALAGASREKADAFLDEQRSLVTIQKHHLREQIKHLDLGIWEKRLGVMLRVATLAVGIVVATGFCLMIWDAAHSKGLLIEPFSVPPDMASHGLTGQVVAAQVLDKLAILGHSESSRSTQSYANNWGNDIKVEIPETGVSISELERFLRGWLGHDTRISGEVYHTATGIAVTSRAGADGATFTGAQTDLDALVQKAAEHVFETTQPYRYANFLDRNYNPVGAEDRIARATAIYHRLIAGNDPVERAWAWNGLGTIAANFRADLRESAADYRRAITAAPDFTIGWFALASRDLALNRAENALTDYRTAVPLLHRESVPDLDPNYLENARAFADAQLAMLIGDFGAAIPIAVAGANLPNSYSVLARGNFHRIATLALARQHDGAGLRRYLSNCKCKPSFTALAQIYATAGNWQALPALEVTMRGRIAQTSGFARVNATSSYDDVRDSFARAHAHLGQLTAAQATIAPTPAGCYYCLAARAIVAEHSGQPGRADYWFARAVATGPSLAFAYADWGEALLARGRPDAAIEKFDLANQKAPHFADPLEMWGEALIAKNQSHLALEKFAEAEKYAPNWGRLHLKWGEALIYAGKKTEAKVQFARAAQLDLTVADKAELAGNLGHV